MIHVVYSLQSSLLCLLAKVERSLKLPFHIIFRSIASWIWYEETQTLFSAFDIFPFRTPPPPPSSTISTKIYWFSIQKKKSGEILKKRIFLKNRFLFVRRLRDPAKLKFTDGRSWNGMKLCLQKGWGVSQLRRRLNQVEKRRAGETISQFAILFKCCFVFEEKKRRR